MRILEARNIARGFAPSVKSHELLREWNTTSNLFRSPFSLGKADRIYVREQKGVLAILRLLLGAGVTPAEGSVKPTAGFTFNQVIHPSLILTPATSP